MTLLSLRDQHGMDDPDKVGGTPMGAATVADVPSLTTPQNTSMLSEPSRACTRRSGRTGGRRGRASRLMDRNASSLGCSGDLCAARRRDRHRDHVRRRGRCRLLVVVLRPVPRRRTQPHRLSPGGLSPPAIGRGGITLCHDQWAFCAPTRSFAARAFYDQHRSKGDTHHQALRALSNRLLGILTECLHHHALRRTHSLGTPNPSSCLTTYGPGVSSCGGSRLIAKSRYGIRGRTGKRATPGAELS